MNCQASQQSSNGVVSNSTHSDIWTDNDIATRDRVRQNLVKVMKLARDMYGNKIVDNALWLANKDYSAMRTAERVKCQKA